MYSWRQVFSQIDSEAHSVAEVSLDQETPPCKTKLAFCHGDPDIQIPDSEGWSHLGVRAMGIAGGDTRQTEARPSFLFASKNNFANPDSLTLIFQPLSNGTLRACESTLVVVLRRIYGAGDRTEIG